MAGKKNLLKKSAVSSEELTHNERLMLIGDYFVRLTQRLVGGKRSRHHKETGDIRHEELDALIEVKGHGSPGDARVFTNQLARWIEKADAFPGFSHCDYVLWTYRNWQGIRDGERNGASRKQRHIRPMGKETPTEESLNRFLAHKTVSAFFVDATILQAMSAKEDMTKLSIQWHRPSVIVRTNQALLNDLADHLHEKLAKLEINPKDFCVRRIRVAIRFKKNLMKFPIVLILRKKHARQVMAAIKGRIEARRRHGPANA